MAKQTRQLDVNGVPVAVSRLDKVLYPDAGFTKGDVIDYYVRVSGVLLPHLRGRPITLKRYPEGVNGFFFYEKQCPAHRPRWVKTTDVPKDDGGTIHYCVMNDLPALVWAANLADLELHTFLHRAPRIERPTTLVFDLDPGAPADVRDCCRVALRLRDLFTALGLECLTKTSGSKGMQLYVPLNTPTTYEKTKDFARRIAEGLEREMAGEVTANMRRSLRRGKVFIDWSQNDDHKTTINVYSLRAKSRPTVSTPLLWREVEAGARSRSASTLVFETKDVLRRIKKHGDLFAPALDEKQRLPSLRALERALQA